MEHALGAILSLAAACKVLNGSPLMPWSANAFDSMIAKKCSNLRKGSNMHTSLKINAYVMYL
eukprot:2455635-Amphidinium_carterae.1